jgi:polysaccharide deacetylase family protein (PEP-CTERM system associated)
MDRQLNLLTIDVEEWFFAEALADRYTFDDWPELPSTLEANCERLLGLFQRRGVLATWFVVGWCAERYPDMIRRIADAGHELACHSYCHRRVGQLGSEAFRQDTEKAVEVMLKVTGRRPIGYRAPSWSINQSVPWAFEILAEFDFQYDSSIFPVKHDIYGMPSGPRQLFRMSLGKGRFLYEIPASTYQLLGQNLPLGGGGYLRHSPYWYSRRMIRRLNRQGLPAMVYVHPWEIDPKPPRIGGLSPLQRFRTYGSTATLEQKLERLLSDFEFATVSDYIRYSTRNRIGFDR